MKRIIYIMCALLMGIFSSCSKSDIETTDGSSDLQAVSVSITADRLLLTRTVQTMPRYAVEVYSDAAYTIAANVFENGNKAVNSDGKFTMIFDRTQTYYCLFWADNGTGYTITDLKAVSLAAGAEISEAFHGAKSLDGSITAHRVILKRAVAKIVLYETGLLPVGGLTMTFQDKPGFNVATAQAVGTAAARTVAVDVNAGVINGILSDNLYVFADVPQKNLVDIQFQFQMKGATAESAFTLNNVPLQANYITNIKGHYTSKAAYTFDITCNDQWESPDITAGL